MWDVHVLLLLFLLQGPTMMCGSPHLQCQLGNVPYNQNIFVHILCTLYNIPTAGHRIVVDALCSFTAGCTFDDTSEGLKDGGLGVKCKCMPFGKILANTHTDTHADTHMCICKSMHTRKCACKQTLVMRHTLCPIHGPSVTARTAYFQLTGCGVEHPGPEVLADVGVWTYSPFFNLRALAVNRRQSIRPYCAQDPLCQP